MDGVLLVSLAGFVMSRLIYVILNFSERINFFKFVSQPGFYWQGALLGGTTALFFYCQALKWDFFKIADLAVFGVTLGLILTKVGQFFSQAFPSPYFSWLNLVEVGLLLITYRLLCVFDKNYRTYEWYKNKKGEASPGFLWASFLGLTSLIYSGSLVLQKWPHPISVLQGFNLAFLLLALLIFYWRSGRGLTIISRSVKKSKGAKKGFRLKAGMEAAK